MPQNYDLFLKDDVGGWNFNADMVNYVLDKHKNSEVHVLVDSLGGYTNVAVSISSLFKLHGNVHIHFVGYNASAATIAAMGAKHITIDEDAMFLVHKCLYPVMEWALMNADDIDEHIKKLEGIKKDNETIDSCIAGMYARRCKKSKDELLALMKEGAWLTPEQALEWGFVDEVTHLDEDAKPVLSEATLSSLSAAGIPLPPNFEKKSSLVERFFAFLKSQFSNQGVLKNFKDAEILSQMDKFSNISALLEVAPTMSDDTLSLSAEQAAKVDDAIDELHKSVDALNAAVADKDAEIASLRDEIAALTASVAEKDKSIAELKKEPAASSSDIVDTKKGDDPYAPVPVADAIAASIAFASM